MELRYYGDSSLETDHEVVVDLLSAIHDRWDLRVAVERVRERHGALAEFPGPVHERSAEAVYERDFANNPLLAANVGHTPEEAFCTENGLPTIAGCVGVVDTVEDGGLLLWSTLLSGEPPGKELFSSDAYTVGFLKEVLEEGPEVVRDKYTTAEDITPPGRLAGDAPVPDDLSVDDVPEDTLSEDIGVGDTVADDHDTDHRSETRPAVSADTRGAARDGTTGRASADTRGTALDETTERANADASHTDADTGADARDPDVEAGSLSEYLTGERTDEDLIAEFVTDAAPMDGVDRGDVRLRVTVGTLPAAAEDRPPADRSLVREFGTRTVDAVVHADRHWLVGTKGRLSAVELDRAVGEVLVADTLYRRQESLDADQTVRALLFDCVGRSHDIEETVELLQGSLAYASEMGVGVFVRDPSLDGRLFRQLSDYGSPLPSVSIDSRAV